MDTKNFEEKVTYVLQQGIAIQLKADNAWWTYARLARNPDVICNIGTNTDTPFTDADIATMLIKENRVDYLLSLYKGCKDLETS